MRLLVTFTFDISLKNWHDMGILDREISIYKKMVKQGREVAFLTYGGSEDLEFDKDLGGIEIFPIYKFVKRPGSRSLRLLQSFFIPFRLKVIFNQFDIYKTNQMLGSWVVVIAKLLYKKKLIVRCGYEWLKNTYRESQGLKRIFRGLLGYFVELMAYTASDKIIVSAPSITAFIKNTFKQNESKITCIPNFVDTGEFIRIEKNSELPNRILYIGRIHKTKNLNMLIEGIRRMATPVGLDIIGEGGDFEALNRYVKENNLDVRFRGIMPNKRLPFEINRYQAFIITSYFENNPKALLEAMACERVVIGSDVDGIKDLINDGISGILVSTDADSIKRGIEKAFSLTDNEKRLLGRKARELVISKSSLNTAINREVGVYEELKI